jgi:glycosyltransferase involved in cell wall biosynthesis
MTPEIQLSICIPAYNRPDWLKRGINSIISQGIVEQIEIIISDDSTDERCKKVVQELLINWSGQWQYQANKPSLGMAENWNYSLKLAQGKYVLVLHDDDFLYSESLQNILTKISDCDRAVMLFGVAVVNEKEKVLKRQINEGYLAPKAALIKLLSNSSFVRFPAMVIQRQVFKEVGFFNAALGEPTDLDMWIRLFSHYGVLCVPTITCAYTVHSQALTMGVFNQTTIRRLLEIFSRVTDVLNPQELDRCKGKFFHQFILAGAFRMLRRKNLTEFRRVMELFNLPELQGLDCPLKWLFFRWVFGILSKLLPSFS